ncbi:MAG: NF038122 family metalloprotease [Acetobacteraceae bacterium]|nr:NF038122 family metalloprotease [Acetobacteraceae bacterium]
MNPAHIRLAVIAALIAAPAAPSMALTINTSFDSSVTSQANALTIEGAFNQATAAFQSILANPVTVNVKVSWGNINGQALPSNALGVSSTSLYGYFSYAQMKSWLTASAATAADRQAYATLPATAPAGESQYVLTSAQAKALGLVAPNGTALDGSIGFGASPYDFNPSDGISAGTYDFVAVAEHELSEVLGRISGLSSSAPAYATALDLFRFTSDGVRTFSYTGNGYFSIDNGTTDLANFNHSTSGGDRGDWYSTSLTTDMADAFAYSGTHGIFSSVDQTALDVVGWGSTGTGTGSGYVLSTQKGLQDTGIPEPASLTLLTAGAMSAAGLRRRRPA